eukprot:TRINITY_DN4960_c1_g2_i1.p1 TRINITY_DN4960_c1_g2~~TRINITY_DN4960_c1_g2_i1.p1  ORF type:complete len:362 (-),score=99.96 TRINITY_DN4960_c1_g2_i1:486-1571(-)
MYISLKKVLLPVAVASLILPGVTQADSEGHLRGARETSPAISQVTVDVPASGNEKAARPKQLANIPLAGFFSPPGITKDGKSKPGKVIKYADGNGDAANTAVTRTGAIDLADCRTGLPPSEVITTFEDSTTITNKVVRITGVTSTGVEYAHCSGTLVAPRVVATAAHCVYDTDANQFYIGTGLRYAYFNIYLLFNKDTGTDYQRRTSTSAQVFTDFMNLATWSDSLSQGSDIAAIQISSAFSGVTPASWFDVATGSTEMRTVVGFPATVQDGKRMVMDTTTDSVNRSIFPRVMSQNLSNEGGMSGGPTFTKASNRMVAITSGGAVDGCPNYYTDVNNYYGLRYVVAAFATVTCTATSCTAV